MTEDTHTHQDEPGAPRAQLGFGRFPTPDPVDAAIERHRAAREGLEHATKGIDAAMTASKQAEAEADAVLSAASDADGAAWADLIATRPADVPGAVRLLRYVSDSPATEILDDPQDLLRQLTAAVEAAETGEGSAGADLAADGPHPSVEPDPALAAVAEFRASWDALAEAIETAGGVGVPEVDPAIEDREGEAYERLKTVRPTTPEGFRALAETWAMLLHGVRLGEPGLQHVDHAADSLIAGAGACVPLATDTPVSPALADLIARHRDLLRQAEAEGLSDEASNTLFDKAWDLFRQACSFPIAGTADLAAKLDLVAAEITEGLERGRTDTAAHAWRCLRVDLPRLGTLDGLAFSAEARSRVLAGGVHHEDGTVSYVDAGGKVWRHPVSRWIAFVAMQLHSRAQSEMARRRQAYGDLSGKEIDTLEARARRELRLDALSDFAFRSDRVFQAAEALRTGNTPGGGASPDGIDHVHALIAEHRSAFAEWDRLSSVWNEMAPSDAGYAEAQAASTGPGKREVAAFEALFSAQPTTLAGTSALAAYLVEVVRRTCIDPDPSDGERALGTLAAALYGIAPGGPFSGDAAGIVSPAPADAALIALGAEFMAAWVEEARDGTTEAYQAVSAVAARIAVAPAETVAGYGVKALLVARLFGESSSPLAPEPVPPWGPVYSVWRMLRQVQEGAARLAGASVEVDASASLAERILSTWAACAASEAASDDVVADRLLERRSALINEAERLPTERQHLVAKALALAWIDYADHHEERLTREDHAIDGRLALDIHAIARVPGASGASGACAGAGPEYDLSGLPLMQLARLYEALEPFEDLIGRAENAACFWDKARTDRTAAGDIIYRESERIGRLTRAIAEEIERRQPADDAERDERLRVLVRRAASLDGLTTDRALLTEALAACAS